MNSEILGSDTINPQIAGSLDPNQENDIFTQSTDNIKSLVFSDTTPIEAASRVEQGLVVLYDFDTKASNSVIDVSNAGEPLNLEIDDPSKVDWGDGVLTVTDDALISANQSNQKLYDEISTSNQFTIEAWISPENTTQSGPVRIATLSSNGRNRNFTLGQEADEYSFRLRTSGTNDNGTTKGELASSNGLVTTDMTHVVYTWKSGQANLYIDNQLVKSSNIGGNLSNWNENYTFALANEITGDRGWQGTYDLVAVYDRSLDSTEIEQNFVAGSDYAMFDSEAEAEPEAEPEPEAEAEPKSEPESQLRSDSTSETNFWSEASTWGGKVPTAGDSVTIPEGKTVVLDVDTADLGGVIVEGNLVFSEDHGDLDFTADWVLVRGGHLEIGTQTNPYDPNATITLNGDDKDVMGMGMGGRFLIATNGGIVDLHSASADKVSWTQLSAHANLGDKTLKLADSVDWQAGDEIVVAPSGFDANEAEQRTVVNVSADGKKVTLDAPLTYQHWGTFEYVDGKPLDMRAEVGLLSRNIDLQAPNDAEQNQFGFHSMFMAETTVRISGVEFQRGGQLGNQGRYPAHWHFANEGSDDYIKDSSIHNSFNRGIVAHGVNNVTVDSNVVYDVTSHAYVFSEDGDERNNSFTNNLGVLIKSTVREDFAFPVNMHFTSGQAEHRASVFWGRNYYNPLVGNHAAGTQDGIGFFFDAALLPHTLKQKIVKSDEPIVFRDNLAHSNQMPENSTNPHYGPLTRGHGLMVNRYAGSNDSEIVFEDFTTYKNNNSGVWIEDKRHTLQNSVIADSSSGIVIMRSKIEDVVMTQNSPNKIGGVVGKDKPFLSGGGAIPGGIHIKRSSYGVSPTISNVTFVDFKQAIAVHKQTSFSDGATVEDIKLINTNPLFWDQDDRKPVSDTGILTDLDGSLTGNGKPTGISGTYLEDSIFKQNWNAYITNA